ncbi:MAG: HAD family hydrolase [Treponema sp.]|jgi:phosphoglycolate phosphatase|nr:HAD family hydrolase [Treponema sp.]
MKFKCVIFDLDGTLVDALDDIAVSMNRALESHGYPPVDRSRYGGMVGWGIKKLAYLALPPEAQNEQNAEPVAAQAAAFYAEQPVVHSRPYPGILELTGELKRLKIRLAVLTNKPDPVAQRVIAGLFPPAAFDIVQGDSGDLRKNFRRKPDPAAAWDIIMALGTTPRETVFVGDSEIDMETALAAECHAVGVSWGYRPRRTLEQAGAQRIIDEPAELLRIIK